VSRATVRVASETPPISGSRARVKTRVAGSQHKHLHSSAPRLGIYSWMGGVDAYRQVHEKLKRGRPSDCRQCQHPSPGGRGERKSEGTTPCSCICAWRRGAAAKRSGKPCQSPAVRAIASAACMARAAVRQRCKWPSDGLDEFGRSAGSGEQIKAETGTFQIGRICRFGRHHRVHIMWPTQPAPSALVRLRVGLREHNRAFQLLISSPRPPS
jgi:hypothetical protein